MDSVLPGTLVRPCTTFYVIPVRRFGSLPASVFSLTSGFLQIPPHDGNPCPQLALPTAERVVVFHHLVVAHAGRIKRAKHYQTDNAWLSWSRLKAAYNESITGSAIDHAGRFASVHASIPTVTGTAR